MDNHHDLLRRSNQPRRNAGFTLIEMAIVLALSAVLLVSFYTFMATELMNSAEQTSELKLQAGIRTPMAQLVQELENAHLYALDSNANWVCYQTPQTGTSGSVLLTTDSSNNAVVTYGATPFDTSFPFQVGGYYQINFVNHTGTNDVMIENQLTTGNYPAGQNISGTYTTPTGTQAFTITYDKGYQAGHFEIECHAAPANGTAVTATGPGGALVGPNRIISGTCLRQIDPTDTPPVTSPPTPKRTSPWGGGFFFMRNPNNSNFTYTTAGASVASGGTWSAQSCDPFVDTNGNGVFNNPEAYTDLNKNNQYDGPDCDGFNDTNGNNVLDGLEVPAATGLTRAAWNGMLRIQISAFDAKKLVMNSSNARDAQAAVRTLTTRVKIRNR